MIAEISRLRLSSDHCPGTQGSRYEESNNLTHQDMKTQALADSRPAVRPQSVGSPYEYLGVCDWLTAHK